MFVVLSAVEARQRLYYIVQLNKHENPIERKPVLYFVTQKKKKSIHTGAAQWAILFPYVVFTWLSHHTANEKKWVLAIWSRNKARFPIEAAI